MRKGKSDELYIKRTKFLIGEGQVCLHRGNNYEAKCNFAMAWGYARQIENPLLMEYCNNLIKKICSNDQEVKKWQNHGFSMITKESMPDGGLEDLF